MDLCEEVAAAAAAISRRFGVEFPAPNVLVDDKQLESLYPITKLSDFARPMPYAIYDDDEDLIVGSSCMEGSMCRYVLLHECAHALTARLNPLFRGQAVRNLMEDPATQQQGYVLHVTSEGIAEYVAIEIGLVSDDIDLAMAAQGRHQQHEGWFDQWRSGAPIEIMSKVYGLPRGDVPAILARYYETLPARAGFDKYALGYLFVSRTDALLQQLIASPPQTFREMLLPDEYRIRHDP